MNSIQYFEIQSSDPQREVRFYSNVFAWQFIRQERMPIEYYRIETEGINGGLLKRPVDALPTAHGTNAFTCSMEVQSFDKTAETILAKGGKIAMPKFAVPGRCWQGYFMDEDNNVFGIFEVDFNAR